MRCLRPHFSLRRGNIRGCQTSTIPSVRPHLLQRQKVNLSQLFAGQTVGIKQTQDRIWLVSFMDYDLGYFDDETCRLEPPCKSLRTESAIYLFGTNIRRSSCGRQSRQQYAVQC
jgi:hypothetical protein